MSYYIYYDTQRRRHPIVANGLTWTWSRSNSLMWVRRQHYCCSVLLLLLAATTTTTIRSSAVLVVGGGGSSSSSSTLVTLGVLADLGPPHPPAPGHFATFRLHAVNASSGAVRFIATQGGAMCPTLDDGRSNCTVVDYADAAAGVVVPAAQAPTGHTTLYFAFTCMCEVHRGTQVYNIWAPPTVAQLDLTTLHAKKVCDTPATLFNTHTQDFVTVGWSSGSGGRLLVSAPMYSPTPAGEPAADEARITTGTRTGATPPNSTVVYVHIDPHSGTVLGKVDGPTRCEACSDQGLMPVLGVGLSAANFSLHVRPFVRVVGGRTTDGTTELVAIDSSTGVVVFNVSMPLDWISWSVEEASGDVVGLGSCLCLASAATPHCPAGTLRTARPPCSSPHACCGLLLPRHTGAGGDDINFSIRTD
jgi:hypothetical protein